MKSYVFLSYADLHPGDVFRLRHFASDRLITATIVDLGAYSVDIVTTKGRQIITNPAEWLIIEELCSS